MLSYLVQFGGARFHPGAVNLLDPLAVLAFSALFAALVLPVLGLIVARTRGRVRRRRERRRRARAAARAERRARTLMSELCAGGWRAQITLGPTGEVTLDWMELRGDDRPPAVIRRVRADTIAEALDAMVADRQTDETLEQIEQRALAEELRWPDV